MKEGEPVGVFVGLQRGFVHQSADGKVCHQQAVEFRGPVRESCCADNLNAAQMGFEFVKSYLDFPAFMIECRQFSGGRLFGSSIVVINR